MPEDLPEEPQAHLQFREAHGRAPLPLLSGQHGRRHGGGCASPRPTDPGKTARHGRMGGHQPDRGRRRRAASLSNIAQGGDEKDELIYNEEPALGIYLATVADDPKSRVYNIGTGVGPYAQRFRTRADGAHLPHAVKSRSAPTRFPPAAISRDWRVRHLAGARGARLCRRSTIWRGHRRFLAPASTSV